MTDAEQVRRAAIKAGLMGTHGTSVPMHKLEAFAAYLLDEENEGCANAVDEIHLFAVGDMREFERATLQDAARTIRARRKA